MHEILRSPEEGSILSRSALFLLGAPRIEVGGTPLQLDTRKALALVAYLAAERGGQTRDALSGLLWPEYAGSRARAALRRTLSALHAAREEGWLVADRARVRLETDDLLWVDLHLFEERLAECGTHGHPVGEVCPRCLAPLTAAVELYRGDFMAGFGLRDSVEFDDWQLFQGESLRGDFAGALDRLVSLHGSAGEWEPAISYARRRLVLDPLHEPAHAGLMRLYALSGRRAAAIKQYRECVKLLRSELGVFPLEETGALYRRINEGATLSPEDAPGTSVARVPATPPATVPPPESPLVGRTEEWNSLLGAYGDARNGGRVAILEGEAGIGKTRLAEEFLAHARASGASVVAARCYPGQANLAYGPFFEGLSAALGDESAAGRLRQVPEHHLEEAARLLPGLGGPAPAPPLDTPGARSRFFEGITEVLFALCGCDVEGSPPGVFFVDDLHWADDSSLDLLLYVTRRLGGARGKPLLVLLAWRPEEARSGHRLQELAAETGRAGVSDLISPGRLDLDAVRELARSTANGVPGGLEERLYDETEGLPLFLSEYLKAITRGNLASEDRVWELPGGVRDLLMDRLRPVSETGWQLLTAAAILGRSFGFDAVREASGRGEWEAVEALEELVARGLVEEVREGNEPLYDFAHDKLRALVLDETSLARRRLLHRRVARFLAGSVRGGRDPGPLAASISHHFRMAGGDEEAAEYARLAGDHARSLYANRDALLHYEAALALGHPEPGALHEAAGDLHTTLGEYAAALASYESAAALLDEAAPARLEHKLGNVYARQGNADLAESHYAAALASLGEGDEGAKARLYADWGLLSHRREDPDGAERQAREALRLAETAADARALARVHNMLGILAAGEQKRAAALSHLEQSLVLADGLGDPDARVAALNNLALVYRTSGDNGRAIELTREALSLCASTGDRHREAALRNNLADLLHSAGLEEESMQQLKQAVAIFAEIGEGDVMRPEIWKLSEW